MINRIAVASPENTPWALALAATVAIALLAGCATTTAPEFPHLVWPAAPQEPRIRFERSLFNDLDLGRDATFNEKIVEFLAGKKPPENRIAEPMGLAVSDDGERLYVADYAQAAVFVFDFKKKMFSKIGRDEPLASPVGVAVDADENVYVVEQEKRGIGVFDRRGKSARFITDPSVERPTGIAIDRRLERIYLADTAHTKSKEHTVKIFDLKDGRLVGHLGNGKGSGDGEFMFPTYVAIDSASNVYVTDTLNSRVQMFDSAGKFVRRFGERGNSWGMFDKPKGVATDTFGNVYVVDSGWSNVQIFNPKGEILLFFGGRGPIPGMLQNPAPIAIDANNRIYVGDYLNHRVEVYQLMNTRASDSFPVAEAPAGKASATK